MSLRVPITSDPRMVRLAQQGLMPSPAIMRMAKLLTDMEALRRAEAVRREAKGEEDASRSD
jgi:hypothetical protein